MIHVFILITPNSDTTFYVKHNFVIGAEPFKIIILTQAPFLLQVNVSNKKSLIYTGTMKTVNNTQNDSIFSRDWKKNFWYLWSVNTSYF